MDMIKALDLKNLVTVAVNDVFEKMMAMEVKPSEEATKELREGDRIVGSVSFAGEVNGNPCLQVSCDFARTMTAAMLEMELAEVEGEEIKDVIGEVSNMIGGNLKSSFCDSGLSCSLSIPYITTGKDFKIDIKDWTRHERFLFCHDSQSILVEVYMKGN